MYRHSSLDRSPSTVPYDPNSTIIRRAVGGLKPSAKKKIPPTKVYKTKRKNNNNNNKKGGGVERVLAQVATFSAPSSFRISASLSIFFNWVASSRSPRAAFSFNSSIAFSYGDLQ